MKVILKSDVKKVGKKGEVVEVSDGYARNFLINKGLAVQATNKSMEILGEQKAQESLHQQELKENALKLKEELKNITLEFKVKSGKEGRVFGSVSTKQIVEALSAKGIKVDKRKFIDNAPIASLGTTRVKFELYKDVIGEVICHLSGNE